jgi:nucleoside-diphosphate-sugar epimerase
MTVLVTGVGFIGGYVVRDLLAAGEQVVLFGHLGGNGRSGDELPEIKHVDRLVGGDLRDKATVIVGNVGDLDALTVAAEQHDVTSIVHLATILSATAYRDPLAGTRANLVGTNNAFEVAARLRMRKVVWGSSSDIFGPRSVPPSGIVTDDCVYDPESAYSASKLMGEKLAVVYADISGVNITGFRPTRVYGFGDFVRANRRSASSWLNDLLYKPVVEPGPVVIPYGSRELDFLYVEDLSEGIHRALHFEDPDGAGSYLVGGDHRPISEAVAFVRQLLPEAQITLDPDDLAPLRSGASLGFARRVDSSRATTAFGYRTRTSMESGILRTINGNRSLVSLPALC